MNISIDNMSKLIRKSIHPTLDIDISIDPPFPSPLIGSHNTASTLL